MESLNLVVRGTNEQERCPDGMGFGLVTQQWHVCTIYICIGWNLQNRLTNRTYRHLDGQRESLLLARRGSSNPGIAPWFLSIRLRGGGAKSQRGAHGCLGVASRRLTSIV